MTKIRLRDFLPIVTIGVTIMSCLGTSGATLTTSPNITDGVLTVCPGDPISITCEYAIGSSPNTLWKISGGGAGVDCVADVSHNIRTDRTCGDLTITMISGIAGPTLSSTLIGTATIAMDGARVECSSAVLPTPVVVGTLNISVLDIPTPSIESVQQISQSSVRVNMSVSDTQCAGTYVATATQQTGTDSSQGTSTSSTVEITGLDLCSYNYDIVGNVVTPTGNIEGNMSVAYPFIANLSGLKGVMNVRSTAGRTSVVWDIGTNPGFENCFFQYTVSWGTGELNVSTTSATREQLAVENFPFCEPVNVTVTPLIRRGPLSNVESTGLVSLIIPGFSDPMIVMVEDNGFTQNNTNDSIVFTNTIQSISDTIVVNRMYGVSQTGMTCTPDMSFTGDSFMASLPSNAHGQTYTVCVSFRNEECMAFNFLMINVPLAEITLRAGPLVTDTAFSTSIDLPISAYLPGQLLLLISVVPNDIATVEAPFPTDYQYTLSLTGLTPKTPYTYTVQIVISNNRAQTVASLTGSFMTPVTPSPLTTQPPTTVTTDSITAEPADSLLIIILAVVLTLLLTLALVVTVCIVSVCLYNKRGRSGAEKQETELRPTDPVYEEPIDIDPTTKGNMAYGHVVRETERRPAAPEYEEPMNFNPPTKTNIAYGLVSQGFS